MEGINVLVIGGFEPREDKATEFGALKERLRLVDLVDRLGLPYFTVDEMWPRDSYVYSEGIFPSRRHGNYGDGGYVYTFEGFTLCSAGIESDFERGVFDSPLERVSRLRTMYKKRVEVLPAPNIKTLARNPTLLRGG